MEHTINSVTTLIEKQKWNIFQCLKNVESLKKSDISEKELLFKTSVKKLSDLKVAAIMDLFTRDCFAPECQLIEITPEHWKNEFQESKPDLFFVESVWRGKDRLWEGKLEKYSSELDAIAKYCRSKNIPMVYWGKEDPLDMERFLPVARMADYVFTTAVECISEYQRLLGHDRVFLLHFAAQPARHNPIEKYARKKYFCYAGSWYNKFPERCKVFTSLTKIIREKSELDIYDRNLGNSTFAFPKAFHTCIRGTLQFEEIDKAYKGYWYGINTNSITQSPSMFARRVFELMASNTLVVGNYAWGVRNYFGDLTICTDDEEKFRNRLDSWIGNPKHLPKRRLLALRKVLQYHLYEDRLDFIVKTVFGKSLKRSLPVIAVFATVKNQMEANRIYKMFERQSYSAKKLAVCANSRVKLPEAVIIVDDLDVLLKNESQWLNDVDYVAYFSASDWYGPNYLLDLALATRYSDADLIGKGAYYRQQDGKIELQKEESAYRFVSEIPWNRAMIRATCLPKESFRAETVLSCEKSLAIDWFNYCQEWKEEACPIAADLWIEDQGIPEEALLDMFSHGWYQRIRPLLADMPVSNGSRFYKKLPLKLGWITDDILYDAYKDAVEGIHITPGKWQEQLKEIDFLFIISCWHGLNNEWLGIAHPGSSSKKIIADILKVCKQDNIPTAFFSCEDPPNYAYFIDIAKQVDYVFTACREVIPDYQRDCKHTKVYNLCYCINPLVHNPVGTRSYTKQSDVLFAGSWYKKYPVRQQDMKILFDGTLEAGKSLRVLDRCMSIDSEDYCYPERYQKYLEPAVSHSELQKIHRLFDWGLNVNTVKDSQSMFANRTYEMLAMGNMTLSNYSLGVNSLLPLIFTTQDQQEINGILNSMTEEEIYEHQAMGVRLAYRGNSCFDRLMEVMQKAGMKIEAQRHLLAVVVPNKSEKMRMLFSHQTYEDKELVTEQELVRDYDQYDMIAFFHPDAWYGDFYLEDMVNGFKYTDSDYVTKDAYFSSGNYIPGKEHDYVAIMPDKYRTVFWATSFNAKQLLSFEGPIALSRGYSIDCLMYDALLQPSRKQERDYDLTVIVAVYNNGFHLYGKCFSSLRRSSIFEHMEILLVDDGSTDVVTPAILRDLERRYSNVRTYFYHDGGSGSASRPRNRGVDMASAKYVTFLDPDNETIHDGFAKLLEKIRQCDADLVVSNTKKFSEKEAVWDYVKIFRAGVGGDISYGGGELLEKLQFQPANLQTMVIRKSLIQKNNLEMMVGAFGEDSLYSWQLLFSASRVCLLPDVTGIYYAGREGSAVNDIGKKFFAKSLILERAQRKWLERNNLLASFMKIRFNYFYKMWYLKHLEGAKPEEKEECILLLLEIYHLYEDFYDKGDATINQFVVTYRKEFSRISDGIEGDEVTEHES